jgi:hypothetical protein
MAQLDKELFIEYIYYIFLVLLHFYSSFFINKTVIWIKVRNFYLNFFYKEIRNIEEELIIIKTIQENLNNKNIK